MQAVHIWDSEIGQVRFLQVSELKFGPQEVVQLKLLIRSSDVLTSEYKWSRLSNVKSRF